VAALTCPGSPAHISRVAMTQATDTGQGGRCVMTTGRISTDPVAGRRSPSSGEIGGAAIHPRFLRSGPWALSVVVALLFGLSFATSYAALYDYSLELQFPREFAIAFPLVLDAVIVVLAVTLLLERALGRRTATVKGRQFTVRLPTWPLLALWGYFAGSVAGNVGHAPPTTCGSTGRSRPTRLGRAHLPPVAPTARPCTDAAGDCRDLRRTRRRRAGTCGRTQGPA